MDAQTFSLDTVSWNSIYLKSGKEVIMETRAERNLTIRINEIMASNSGGIADEFSEQDDWFELYNYGDEDVVLNGLFFTDDDDEPYKWSFQLVEPVILTPGEFRLFWADGTPEQGIYHTNFKISSDGEYLGIFSEDGDLIDEVDFGPQNTDISYGRYPDGGPNFYFSEIATPDTSNINSGTIGVLDKPKSNLQGGLFDQPQYLKIEPQNEDSELRFTLNCNEPTDTSAFFPDSLLIHKTTIVRVKAFKQNYASSPTLTLSFIFEKGNFANPVISLVSNENDLNGTRGLLSSISQDIEIPGNFEFLVQNQSVFNGGTGIKLHSPKATTKQYSLRLYARGSYGNSWFEYPFFDELAPDKFKRLILRNAGNDNVQTKTLLTHFRDPLMQRLAKNTNERPLISEIKVVNVYLNGKFYGIYNLRERIDEYYIETHTGAKDSFDLLERAFGYSANQNALEGNFDTFQKNVNYLVNAPDKNQGSTLDSIQQMFDWENFRDYWITEVFGGNYDWLSNNVKFWRPENGRWQWIYWDLDHTFGLPFNNYGLASWNTLDWSLGFTDRAWSNGYNNRVARNLLKNEVLKSNFIQRFTYLLNTAFTSNKVKEQIDSIASIYRPDMPRHLQRWKKTSLPDWENAVVKMHEYAQQRPDWVMQHLQDKFALDTPVKVNIQVEPAYGGQVHFSTGWVTKNTFTGKFFPNMVYSIKAHPADGFEFVGWEGTENKDPGTEFLLSSDTSIKAVFAPIVTPEPLVLNEVFYYSSDLFQAGPWLEIRNNTNQLIDISGYKLKVNDQLYTFPEQTQIKAQNRLVVVKDKKRFHDIFLEELAVVEFSNLSFSSNYEINLLSNHNELLDNISNNNPSVIAAINRKKGFSTELTSHYLDNSNFNNWKLSENRFGSPGLDNNLHYSFVAPESGDLMLNYDAKNPTLEVPLYEIPYYDKDQHTMTAIKFTKASLPEALTINDGSIQLDSIYLLNDVVLHFNGATGDAQFSFKVIDASGDESDAHILFFTKVTGAQSGLEPLVKIYPNPSQNELFINGVETGNSIKISFWTLNGQMIKVQNENQIKDQTIALDLRNLPAGTYIIRLQYADKEMSRKLIIER